MSRKRAIIMIVAAMAGVWMLVNPVFGRKRTTTRPRLERIADTTQGADADLFGLTQSQVDSIRLSGYDKPLRSHRESIFITNSSDADIERLTLSLSYFDMEGRELHHRDVEVRAAVPAGSTRQITFPSWDRQLTFVYHRSERSKHGVLYTVKATVKSANGRKNSSADTSKSGAEP